MLSAAGFRAGNLINKKNIEIGGQVLPLKRTNLIPATFQEKEKERERRIERERVKEREREREKVFPSLRDSESSYRSVRAAVAGVKAGTGTEACSSTRKGRYCHLFFLSSSPFFLSLSRTVYLFYHNHFLLCAESYLNSF